MHFEIGFDFNHPYVMTEEDILRLIGASWVSESIEDDSKTSGVVVRNVSIFSST